MGCLDRARGRGFGALKASCLAGVLPAVPAQADSFCIALKGGVRSLDDAQAQRHIALGQARILRHSLEPDGLPPGCAQAVVGHTALGL